ncbi:MAG: hypothetical protein CHACPFDD_03119 [Phycisphaerae bacterium]|nr:hypothetical protein [Phycisphaerae bacterium]
MRNHAPKRPGASNAAADTDRQPVEDRNEALTTELVAAALECPWCHRRSTGAVLERHWHDHQFWQVRACSECSRLLVAITEMDGERIVHTHGATLRLCLSEPPFPRVWRQAPQLGKDGK